MSSGFGTSSFGTGTYGSDDSEVPYVVGALSLSGTEIEVFFSAEMDTTDPALVDNASYELSALVGASVSLVSVASSSETSVVLTHTGTTLGGVCKIRVVGEPRDYAGNTVSNPVDVLEADPFNPTPQDNEAILYTLGDTPTVVGSAPSGTSVLLTFSEDLLDAGDEPSGTIGVGDVESYEVLNTVEYPIEMEVQAVTHPYMADDSQVLLTVQGMTSIPYDATVSPALAFSYNPTVLPSADPTFSGASTGAGTSVISSGALSLSKGIGEECGWRFLDLSGRLEDQCTFRVDFEVDAGGMVCDPALSTLVEPSVGTLVVDDGVRALSLTFKKALDGSDALLLESGTYGTEVQADWSQGPTTISVLRNRKADIYSVLVEGYPVLSANMVDLTGTAVLPSPGVSWNLPADLFSVEGFQILGLDVTASNTVYTATYNFLHGVVASFTGSDAFTRSSFLTQKGPLTKDWGDATPASKQDVHVYIDDTEVEVAAVNPYLGEITLAIPIPRLPMGSVTVTTDYTWFPSPIMHHVGWNTPGLLYNQWVHATGYHHPARHGEAASPMGFASAARFPFSSVIGPLTRRQPLQVGYRYIGFEKAYSALLNSPTTLLWNQAPNRVAVPGFIFIPEGVTGAFEGLQTPPSSSPVWELLGTDAGGVNIGEGTYTVLDAKSGGYDPDDPSVVVYHRGLDLSFPAAWYMVCRFQVLSTTPFGVYTGVGFGLHDNNRIYLVGALSINGLEHVGLLRDARRPDEVGSWYLGLQLEAEALTQTTLSVATALLPDSLSEGDRLQVLEGAQEGVYVISTSVQQSDGTTTITLSTPLPALVNLYEHKFFDVVFESRWSDGLCTYRLEVASDEADVTLQSSGTVTATLVSLSDALVALPEAAYASLLVPVGEEGQVFWGSLSFEALNETVWSFARYGVVPNENAIRGYQHIVRASMDELPTEESDEWFLVRAFGTAQVDSSGSRVLLKSDCGSEDYKLLFGYGRIENFLSPTAKTEVTATFRVDSGSMGAGDALISIKDTRREVRMGTLLYVEDPSAPDYRSLLQVPSLSAHGLRLPSEQGWDPIDGFTATAQAKNDVLLLTQSNGKSGAYTSTLDTSEFAVYDTGSRILEARFAVKAATVDADGRTGVAFSAEVGDDPYRIVGLEVVEDGVLLVTGAQVAVQAYTFDWTGGEEHTYRILADVGAGTVTLLIDDVVQTPTTAITSFSGGSGNVEVSFGVTALNPLGVVDLSRASRVEWSALSVVAYPPTAAKRTLGIYKGGDDQHIDSWEIPRTDSTTALNSAQTGPVIEEMDWRSDIQVKLLRDPTWGVTLFRPDLALPPYYVAENPAIPGTGHTSYMTQPSAGWINVEEVSLPTTVSSLPLVTFGALDQRAITQQRWSNFRYRVFKHPTEDRRAPQHMLYNQFNVVSSGERSRDKSPEVVEIQARDLTSVSLRPTHYYAEYIYKVIDGDTIYTPDDYTFDRFSQVLQLLETDEGVAREFSSANAVVTVVFKHSTTVTTTYLEDQPLTDSVHLLNEHTPPIAKSQVGTATRIVNADGVVEFQDDPAHLYEELTFIQVDNGGVEDVLSLISEGLLASSSGWEEGVGEEILDSTGTGTGTYVGAPFGSFVIAFSGAEYEESLTFSGWDDINPLTNTASASGLGSALIEIDDGGVVSTTVVTSEP